MPKGTTAVIEIIKVTGTVLASVLQALAFWRWGRKKEHCNKKDTKRKE